MANDFNQDEINGIVWKACDTFRGAVDPSEYKNYILTMLFLKYLSDLWKDRQRELAEKYKGNKERIERALSRERFVVPDECDFDYLYAQRDAPNIGELINVALEKIEDANKAKLENVFRNIDFNSEPALGQTKERNRRLKNLLEDFNDLAARPAAVAGRQPRRHRRRLRVPDRPVRRRRGQEGGRVLHAARSLDAPGQARPAQAGRPDLRSRLRFRLAADSRGQGSR